MSGRDVIIALDFPDRKEALDFLGLFPEDKKPFVKIGMELFYAEGPALVREIKEKGQRVFLDLKLHDIPNTVRRTMSVLRDLDVDIVNLYAAGSAAMMRAALEGLGREGRDNAERERDARPLLIAVTQLTSIDGTALKNELLIDKTMSETVFSYARNAAACGLDGVVCSPLEAAGIKQACGENFITVTPGIRFEEAVHAPGDDQKRIMTPAEAARNGCDYLVMGRPITEAPDPVAAYRRALAEFGVN